MGRRANGEGSIYSTIQKVKRKKFDTRGECAICRECTDRTLCNNRIGHIKCEKCKNCKEECLKYCDRFYCQKLNIAQISVKGKKKTVGSDTVQKNATEKKNKAIAKIQNGTYLDKSSITLFQIAVDIQDEKLKNGDINENTYGRNLESIEYIKKILGENLKIQKATSEDIKKLLRSKRDEGKSQSDINKLYNIVNASFRKAVLDKIITTADNPMNYIDTPISKKIKKEVIAFEVEEQATLLQYINTHTIITDSKSAYDDTTVKNLIRTAFLIGARCGELGALDYTKHIDWEQERVIIEKTLTKNKDRKIVMGETTKTGRKNIKSNNSATRFIPFDVFDKEQLIDILEEQIIIANNTPNNCEHLLFCKKDGTYIIPSQINQIFKRVCREAGVKQNLVTGCNTHMTKHTFVTRAIESGMSLLTISKLVGTSVRELEKTYAHVLDKFMKVELEGLRKHLKNSKIIAFPKAKRKEKSIS